MDRVSVDCATGEVTTEPLPMAERKRLARERATTAKAERQAEAEQAGALEALAGLAASGDTEVAALARAVQQLYGGGPGAS